MTTATPTELCNVALGHLGQARIADIGERSPAAEHCRRMFDHVRRLCLRDHDWNFAVRRAALTALETPPPFGFSAAYQLPADCLRVLAINGQPAGVRGTQWEVEGRTVLINADVAHLRYIADADDVTQWDSIFAAYFGYRLAAAIAPSLRLDPQAGLQIEQMAAAVRASAQEADNVETAPRVTRLDQSEIIQERGSRWPSGTASTGTGNTSGSMIGWGSIAVAGQPTVAATLAGDTLTLEAGANVTITTDPLTKKVTIAATGGGGGGTVNLTPSRTATAVTITPSGGGTAAEIPQANDTHAGVLTAAHHQTIQNLGTISTQNSSNVAITGGSITGITDLAIADGGTGASTAGQALTNLGAYPASNPNGYTTNTGTVTSVSVTTASGVSATVTNGTTTPALSFTLGAITPSSVNGITFTNGGSGALTVTGTASVSGTNTGDQTIALTGDVTGSGTGSFAATIASNAITTAKLDAEAVTYAKIQALSAASRLLGRGTTGGALVREISIGAGLSMSGDVLSATVFNPAAPGAIGGTTPSTAVFTQVDVRTELDIQSTSGSAGPFYIWNTPTTEPTNWTRARLQWVANVFTIGTQRNGTGTALAIDFQTGGTTRATIGAAGGLSLANGNALTVNGGAGGRTVTLSYSSISGILNTANEGGYGSLLLQCNGSTLIELRNQSGSLVTLSESVNFVFGTTTGTRIGTATSQRIGFWNATPVVQPAAVADATDAASAITQLNALLSRLRTTGIIAT